MERLISASRRTLVVIFALNLVLSGFSMPIGTLTDAPSHHLGMRRPRLTPYPATAESAALHTATLALGTTPLAAGEAARNTASTDATNPERIKPPAKKRRQPSSLTNRTESLVKPASKGLVTALGPGGLTFIENKGQFDNRVKFQVRGNGRNVWLTDRGIVFDFMRRKPKMEDSPSSGSGSNVIGEATPSINLRPRIPNSTTEEIKRQVIYQDFVGAKQRPTIETDDVQPGEYNYLVGSDPTKWQTHVRGFGEVIYRDVWDGVDLRLYGKGADLEQEFVVRPGGNLDQVQVAYRGIEKLEVTKDGSLLIHTPNGGLRESPPCIFQDIAGKRVPIKGRFKLTSATAYGFEVGSRNSEYALVIDPTLLYSTFLGGSTGYGCFIDCAAFESGNSVAVDSQGNAYVSGFTFSSDFPTTPGAYQTTAPGGSSIGFVTKLNALGSQLIYSTYFPAVSQSIAVDSAGEAYIAGSAGNGFPTTPNAYQQSCNSAPFVTKLNSAGNGLVYSTCFGQASDANILFLALDRNGRAYITGRVSSGIPTTAGAFQPTSNGALHAFLSVIDPAISGSAGLVYSTFLGGSNTDAAEGVAVDPQGMAYIAGWTTSSDFPVTIGAFETQFSGGQEGFVAKLNPGVSGNASLLYSTYLGPPTPGPNAIDIPAGIAVDAQGNAYVAGAASSASFPVTPGAFQTVLNGSKRNAFVTKLNPSGRSLVYSTFLGGASGDGTFATSIALNASGEAYVTGSTVTTDFPTTPDAFQPTFGGRGGGFFFYGDVFVTKLNASGTALVYSSYLGGINGEGGTGIAVDTVGDAYVTGFTSSPNFPVTQGAFQPRLSPGSAQPADAFVTKFPLGSPSGSLSIVGVLPGGGGNSGTVTVTVVGSGFEAGVSAKLICPNQTDIVGSSVVVDPSGRTLTATFNLVGTTPAACNLVVTNPDGATLTASNQFTIQQGGAPDVWIDIVGRNVLRAGAGQQYYAIVGNRGNVDAPTSRIWISFPIYLAWDTGGQLASAAGQMNGFEFVAFDVSPPAGSSTAIPLLLTAPDDPSIAHQIFQLQLWVQP